MISRLDKTFHRDSGSPDSRILSSATVTSSTMASTGFGASLPSEEESQSIGSTEEGKGGGSSISTVEKKV